ncbi:ROK family transcriptional regulator [Demequina sp. NBRC 110051]|uniref:ROK family transcriptional regulator n=1 Tax=Demequina sp. NBRC 110051 TaxID=1570340 RepID=UPI000A04D2E2|nr:ROK family transcriptional regulator [Demequina sp. NBRC 110051]
MSTMTGAHTQVRRTHEVRVLDALRQHGAMSRSELARRVGLSRTTLSDITADLLLRGAIVVADTDAAVRSGSGRPAERLAVDPASGQFLGVDFGHRRVTVAIADASHNILAEGACRYESDANWERRLAAAYGLIDDLATRNGVHLSDLQAIGIGVPGPYTYACEGAPTVTWKKQLAPDGVDRAFEQRFGAPVMVDNNTRLAALAEAIAGPSAADDLIYVRLSDGVGGGLIVAGRLVMGTRGYAGELGHVNVDPHGARCQCGKRGCLETVASVPAILGTCRANGLDVETLDDLAEAVRISDPVAERVLRDAGGALGRVLGGAAMTLNPDEVVIGGEIVHIAPVLVEQAASTLRYELSPIPTDQTQTVRAALLRDNDGAVGAIASLFHQSPLAAAYSAVAPSGRRHPHEGV